MRTVRLASLLVVAVLLNTACEKTADSPGKGDSATPYGGADASANGSIGSTPGYLNAAGIEKNPNTGKPAAGATAAPVPATPAAGAVTDTTAKAAKPAAPAKK